MTKIKSEKVAQTPFVTISTDQYIGNMYWDVNFFVERNMLVTHRTFRYNPHSSMMDDDDFGSDSIPLSSVWDH